MIRLTIVLACALMVAAPAHAEAVTGVPIEATGPQGRLSGTMLRPSGAEGV